MTRYCGGFKDCGVWGMTCFESGSYERGGWICRKGNTMQDHIFQAPICPYQPSSILGRSSEPGGTYFQCGSSVAGSSLPQSNWGPARLLGHFGDSATKTLWLRCTIRFNSGFSVPLPGAQKHFSFLYL